MKKLLLILYVICGLVIASPKIINEVTSHDPLVINHNNLAKTDNGFIEDEKIAIEVSRDSNRVKIDHKTNYVFTGAVLEYVIVENNQNISRLETFDVRNNEINLTSIVGAIKIHQLLFYKENVRYRYSTTGTTSAPSNYNWNNVIRKNIAEITTTDVRIVKSTTHLNPSTGRYHEYFEFYFDFKYRHDKLLSIDVDYNIRRVTVLGKKHPWLNVVDEKLSADEKWELKKQGYNAIFANPENYPSQFVNILEVNTNNSIRGTHVARIAPSAHNYPNDVESDAIIKTKRFEIENFAIIRVEYKIDGEHVIDDVLNAPITPERPKDTITDSLQWFYDLIDDIKGSIKKFTNLISSNFGTIGVVIAIIIGLILIGPLMFVFKGLGSLIKLVFKGLKQILLLPKKLFDLLKYLFVPPKNKK